MKIYTALLVILVNLSIYAQHTQIDSTDIFEFYYDDVKYEVVKNRLTWPDAADYAYQKGAMLAEITSQEEQDTIFSFLEKLEIVPSETRAPDGGNASYVWIGGNDLEEEGKWIWDGADDGVSTHFWQGTTSGSAVENRYSNWGLEPDNFGNQDALGLAITRWPLGVEGQWNDIYHTNELYFVLEYNPASIRINSAEYSYDDESLIISPEITTNFDSIHIVVDGQLVEKKNNISEVDTLITTFYSVDISTIINLRLFGFKSGSSANSREVQIQILSFANPIDSYATDFEDNPIEDFISIENGFIIDDPFPFRNFGIHSLHDYQDSSDYTMMFRKPIRVSDINSIISFSEIVVVEPGDTGSIFGNDDFRDYVIIEGSKNINEWIPLVDGYDSRLHEDWENAWNSGGYLKNLFKRNSIDLNGKFDSGDTVLIRFRLHSDLENSGWGWVIDSLEIQNFPLNNDDNFVRPSFDLGQNYPNPFNPSTTITFTIPSEQNVKVTLFDALGRKVKNIINGNYKTGFHEVKFYASDLSSGIYFYRIETDTFSDTKQMILLK